MMSNLPLRLNVRMRSKEANVKPWFRLRQLQDWPGQMVEGGLLCQLMECGLWDQMVKCGWRGQWLECDKRGQMADCYQQGWMVNRILGIKFQKISEIADALENMSHAPESYRLDVKQEHVGCGRNILGLKLKPSRGFEPWRPMTTMLHHGVLAATTLAVAVSAQRIVSNNSMSGMACKHTDWGVQLQA